MALLGNGPKHGADAPQARRIEVRRTMADLLWEKLVATGEVCRVTCLPGAMRWTVGQRMIAGHDAHAGGDAATLDLQAEAREELADVAGYAALARLTGKWGWRWAVAVVLAGLAWRVLGHGDG